MNKNVEKYIVSAMPILKRETNLIKEHKGNISSLGASIRMSGLLPAIAFYSAKEERNKILLWIFEILKLDNAFENMDQQKDMLDLALALHDKAERRKLERHIEDASVALKLCLRTFSLSKKNTEHG